MLDLEGRAPLAVARWGPGVHQQPFRSHRREEGSPVSADGARQYSSGTGPAGDQPRRVHVQQRGPLRRSQGAAAGAGTGERPGRARRPRDPDPPARTFLVAAHRCRRPRSAAYSAPSSARSSTTDPLTATGQRGSSSSDAGGPDGDPLGVRGRLHPPGGGVGRGVARRLPVRREGDARRRTPRSRTGAAASARSSRRRAAATPPDRARPP